MLGLSPNQIKNPKMFYGLIRKIAYSIRKLGWITELQKSQIFTKILTVGSIERNPEIFFGDSVKSNIFAK
jgi:hypothetical protein